VYLSWMMMSWTVFVYGRYGSGGQDLDVVRAHDICIITVAVLALKCVSLRSVWPYSPHAHTQVSHMYYNYNIAYYVYCTADDLRCGD
jgi:hypothetical protein